MDKVVLLKTQLAEAASFARSKRLAHKRLAVILLDNFVEIQLAELIRLKFSWDGEFYFQEKKYPHEKRIKILNHYDELLKTCIKEGIITLEEQRLLSFCHNVRNNLYHKIDEEVLLIQCAIAILHYIITKYQPHWKTARAFTTWTKNSEDPYYSKQTNRSHSSGNSELSWEEFLKKYFVCVDRRSKNVSKLISEYLIEKIKDTKSDMHFINGEFKIFFPYTKNWDFNDFLLHYSFLNIKHDEIEKIKEIKDRAERKEQYDALFLSYKNDWRYKKKERLKTLEAAYKGLATLPIEKSIEKFFSYKDEIKMINEAFDRAARDLDGAIQNAIDLAREK